MPQTPSSSLRFPAKESTPVDAQALTIAYAQAIIDGVKILDDIADSLSVIAMYYQKKGLQDKVFTAEDMNTDASD